VIKYIFESFLYSSLDENYIHKAFRKRREYSRYYSWLLSPENVHLTPKRKGIIEKYRGLFRIKSGLSVLPNEEEVNFIRDLAIKIEKEDIESAAILMAVAGKLRCDGRFIKRKQIEYKRRTS
jgi:hypothetical protein